MFLFRKLFQNDTEVMEKALLGDSFDYKAHAREFCQVESQCDINKVIEVTSDVTSQLMLLNG